MDQFQKKQNTKTFEWAMETEKRGKGERKKKTTRGGKGMHSVKYGANKKNKVYGGQKGEKNLRREEEGKKMFFSTIRALT